MFEPKADKVTRKLERTQKEEKARKKSRIIKIAVITVLLLTTATAIILNSGFIRRTVPVVTVDGIGFNTAEFEFFFNSEYMEYANFMSQFQGMGGMLPEQGIPLSRQIYDIDQETGEETTWADYFVEGTINRLINLVSIYKVARENGFELSEEDRETIEQEFSMMSMQSMFSGFPSVDSYLKQVFGAGMNEKVFFEVQEFMTIASAYSMHVRDSFEYSANELAEHYAENANTLDVINYRQFMVTIEYLDYDDFASDEEFNQATEAALEEARFRAAEIIEGINSEPEFIEAAGEYMEYYSDPESTLRMTQAGRLDVSTSDWLLDETRSYGDTGLFDTDQGTNIVLFVSRDDNNYRTVGMRQILILREQIDPMEFPGGDFDPDYLQALETAERETTERAEEIYMQFVASGETEAAFNELMLEFSDDTTPDGTYSDITKYSYQSEYFSTMKVVPEIEEWLFYEGRVVGDTELIHTSDFGYHLLYFNGLGEPFFELIADDRMRTDDHTAWLDSLIHGEAVKHFAMRLLVQM